MTLKKEILVKKHSELDELKAIELLLGDWLIICMAILLYKFFDNLWLYPCAVIVIGARQHALGVICHDIVHYRFLKNRLLSDWIGNLFITWPMFFTINGYRSMHLRHHSHVNTDQDPDLVRREGKWDWTFPKTKIELYSLFLMDITGLNTLQYIKKLFFFKTDKKLKEDYKKVSPSHYILQAIFYIVLFGFLIVTNNLLNYFLFWIVPMLTWLKFAKRIRAMAEHFGIPNGEYDELTRTTIAGPLEKFLICPHGINYHVEHHRYAGVPMYNLEAFHKDLKQAGYLQTMGHISQGYFKDVISEMTRGCELNRLIRHLPQ